MWVRDAGDILANQKKSLGGVDGAGQGGHGFETFGLFERGRMLSQKRKNDGSDWRGLVWADRGVYLRKKGGLGRRREGLEKMGFGRRCELKSHSRGIRASGRDGPFSA